MAIKHDTASGLEYIDGQLVSIQARMVQVKANQGEIRRTVCNVREPNPFFFLELSTNDSLFFQLFAKEDTQSAFSFMNSRTIQIRCPRSSKTRGTRSSRPLVILPVVSTKPLSARTRLLRKNVGDQTRILFPWYFIFAVGDNFVAADSISLSAPFATCLVIEPTNCSEVPRYLSASWIVSRSEIGFKKPDI
jgi:hypothetical protein